MITSDLLLLTLSFMRSFRSEPFLWIHLAGLAAVPLLLQAVWLGLAVGEPLPFWLELLFVAAVGIIPTLWMQLRRPFDIFSLLIVAVKPEQLTADQRRILSLLRTKKHGIIAIAVAALALVILWQLYQIAPVAAVAASFLPQVRILGLLLAAIAFFMSNLFIQVPFSVVGVLLTDQQQFANAQPIPSEAIRHEFTVPGFRVNQFLSTPVNSTLP